MWQAHYFQRSFIYPFKRAVKPGDTTPLLVPVMAFFTNIGVSFLNASILSWPQIRPIYENSWLTTPQFVAGAAVFASALLQPANALDYPTRPVRLGEPRHRISHFGPGSHDGLAVLQVCDIRLRRRGMHVGPPRAAIQDLLRSRRCQRPGQGPHVQQRRDRGVRRAQRGGELELRAARRNR